MTGKNPLDLIKHVAHSGLAAGAHLARSVARIVATDSPSAHRTQEPETPVPSVDPRQTVDPAPPPPAVEIDPDRPVNVVKELGLDPAPVPDTSPKPTTRIDAAADPESVEATPADVAKVVDPDQER
ncbi:hypothetical protein [Nocardioides daejeonensis]|uniref:hypothetical protein n=1 Tax=Nocardioides daejeonensis TaxID=1046556 RepID=UPI000D74FCBA|nr:hypothetical protein [Nocardioides daejeonensis]